jgi:hypothetical protein
MSRRSYFGGSSRVSAREHGTAWGSSDPAEERASSAQVKRERDRRPTGKEISEQEALELAREQRDIRSFISECVRLYSVHKLTANTPVAPKVIRKRVSNAGGNVRWLEANGDYQRLFHAAFCRLRNDRTIPFESVWGRAAPK